MRLIDADALNWGTCPASGKLTKAWLDTHPTIEARPVVRVEARPLEEWGEDYGDVLWWKFPIEEPPYVGSPLDCDWSGYHTHWTPIEVPEPPNCGADMRPKEATEMLEINCNICTNCDLENDRCRLYGSDPEIATARCAEAEFKGYWPREGKSVAEQMDELLEDDTNATD